MDDAFTSAPQPRPFGRLDDFADGPRDPLRRQAVGGIPGETAPALRDDLRAGMQHYVPTLGPMIGYGYIVWGVTILLGVFPYLGSCLQALAYVFIVFAFRAGYVVVGLKQMRGQSWQFGDLFAGFNWWSPLFLNNLLAVLLFAVCFVPGYAAVIGGFIYAVLTPAMVPPPGPGGAPPPPPNLLLQLWPVLAGLAVMLVGVLPYAFFYTRLFAFGPFLIIDRRIGPMEAIAANWRITRGASWGWFRYGLALLLIYAVGMAPCCIGTPFLAQVWYLTFAAAYLRMTGHQEIEGPQ